MNEAQLEVLFVATLACNWLSFAEFVEFVDNADNVTDTDGVLSLFNYTVH
jgi:hypothetical protein